MQSLEKIAVFDFCETLVPFQSADKFVDYIYSHNKTIRSSVWRFVYRLLGLICFLRFCNRYWPNLSIGKRLMTKQLKGINETRMNVLANDFYEHCIKPCLIPDVIKELSTRREEGFIIVLVSGGFDVYLKFFADDFRISSNHVITTKLEKKEGLYTGRIEGVDCMRANKVYLLEKVFNRNSCKVLVYSDSYSDLPLFQWADESYVISKNGYVSWANKLNNLKRIIKWEN